MSDHDKNIPLLQARDSNTRAFVEFQNKTKHPVDIFWVNYTGGLAHYTCLKQNGKSPINTYVSHPWIAKSFKTKERMMVNGRDIFFPQPYFRFITLRGQSCEISREQARITFGMRSLLNICKDSVASLFNSKSDIEMLEIPKSLKLEIIELFKVFNDEVDRSAPAELQIIRS